MDLVVLEDDGQRKLMVRADFGSLDREAAPFLYSRDSADREIRTLAGITNDVLENGRGAVPPLPTRKVIVSDNRPVRQSKLDRALSNCPIDPATGQRIVPDSFDDDGEEF